MEQFNLKNYTGGWFIGDFDPAILRTGLFEVAVKKYKAGSVEKKHYHSKAIEFTVIVDGQVLMNNNQFENGSIIQINVGEETNFEALTDVTTVVVKIPSVK